MTSSKPYLLRALYEWILDNDMTPHVIVDVNSENVEVPMQAVQDGRLVLNVSPSATRNFVIENDYLGFQARFSGTSHNVWIPMNAILAIYARENGQGMMFSDNGEELPEPPDSPDSPDSPDTPEPADRPAGPKLRVIK